MPTAESYVNNGEPAYAPQAQAASGAPAAAGMAPYPLYGIPLGEGEVVVPFYKRPLFCSLAGATAGFGLGYLVFGWLKPRMKDKSKKKVST